MYFAALLLTMIFISPLLNVLYFLVSYYAYYLTERFITPMLPKIPQKRFESTLVEELIETMRGTSKSSTTYQ